MATVASYSAHVESNQEIKKQIKKEWVDEEAKHKHGGRRRWQVWFVQLICELLVCVTAPLAIGLSIKIMYKTLNDKQPEEESSASFIHQCRVVMAIGRDCDCNEMWVGRKLEAAVD